MQRYLTDERRTFEASSVKTHRSVIQPEMNLVKAYPQLHYQTVVGFGAALTEAAGYVYAQMPADVQQRFVELCFGAEGNRYSLARLSIQSCDFSLVPRPYARKRADALAGFSIEDDWGYVLPLVKAAQAKRPDLQFLASPWSPPAWAKTNGTMKFGGHLKRRDYDLWAAMIAQTLLAYAEAGVEIGRITVQNEPQARQTWESCLFSAEQEGEFLHEALCPALKRAGLGHVKVFVWDHNKESALDRAAAVLADPSRAADVDGVAFHWYSGDHFEAVRATRELIGPDRELLFTEGCDCFTAGDPSREIPHAEHYAHELIGDLEAGANGALDWNALLDAQGGPNHVGNFCDAPIMYDVHSGQLNVRRPFYYLGHFSRFIQPGARRMLVTRYHAALETCGFANPDGTFALVVLNRSDDTVDFDFTCGDLDDPRPASATHPARIARLSAPAHSIQTFCW